MADPMTNAFDQFCRSMTIVKLTTSLKWHGYNNFGSLPNCTDQGEVAALRVPHQLRQELGRD
jgi:hypothetical protein